MGRPGGGGGEGEWLCSTPVRRQVCQQRPHHREPQLPPSGGQSGRHEAAAEKNIKFTIFLLD